jgi:hypothetical protein
MDNHSPVETSLQIRDERGALPCGVCTLQNTGLFSHGVYTPTAEKCDAEHICFHSARLLRGPSFGYPEHSNWQRGFWQCSNFTSFTHPTKQTNKQTNKRGIICGYCVVRIRKKKVKFDSSGSVRYQSHHAWSIHPCP